MKHLLQTLGAKGFRPFFLLAGAFATVVVPLWMGVWTGHVTLRGMLQGVQWHAHEMIFGFTVALVAGFLLTAVENWTKQRTLQGPWLLGLVAVWAAARVALLLPGWIGPALDLAVLPLVAVGIGRPLLVTGNVRNLPFLGLLAALWCANGVVYLDAAGALPGAAVLAHRVSVYVIALIILVVTGRIVPLFTRNATGDARVGNRPWLDHIALGATAGVALLQLQPDTPALPVVAGLAGAAVLLRMTGWWTAEVLRRPLLWVLHLGHAAVGVGMLITAAQPWVAPLGSAGLHTVTVGGIGLLTLGMMARVSLGHTGRTIRVGAGMALAFGAIGLALVLRVVGPWVAAEQTSIWLWAAAACWAGGFGAFTWAYRSILTSPRADGRPG